MMSKRSASITVAGLALGSLLLAGSPAGAQSVYAPYVDQREAYQQQRIQQGIDSGALTPGETRSLEKEQTRIDRAEGRMLADGNLSPRERQRLNQMQNQASRDIYRLQNNNRTTAGWGGNNYYGWSGHTNSGWGGNTNDPRFERREAYQEQRIQQGINSGALTPGEARYLNREQGRIDRVEDRMLADGNLSPRERQRLNQMQNQASRDIYRLENNNRTTAGYNGNQAGWQGNNRGWNGRDYGWHGNNPVSAGNTPGGNGYNHGWQGNGNSGWQGNNPAGNGNAPGATTAAGNTQGWHGSRNSGWQGNYSGGTGHTPGGTTPGGTTTAGNTQGGPGNYVRNGQPGAYPQAGAQAGTRSGQPTAWQGQQQYQRPSNQGSQPQMRQSQPAPWQGQQYQQARMQAPQTQMRPNVNMMPRQPGGSGGMVNRASFSVPRAAPRKR